MPHKLEPVEIAESFECHFARLLRGKVKGNAWRQTYERDNV